MKHFPNISQPARKRLGASFAAYALRAQARAVRARAMGNMDGWAMHMRRASQLAHKADMLGA